MFMLLGRTLHPVTTIFFTAVLLTVEQPSNLFRTFRIIPIVQASSEVYSSSPQLPMCLSLGAMAIAQAQHNHAIFSTVGLQIVDQPLNQFKTSLLIRWILD